MATSPPRRPLGSSAILADLLALGFLRVAQDGSTVLLPDNTSLSVGGGGSGTVTSVAALTLGTTGSDLSSTVATATTTPVITLNVPSASASNRGVLLAADWTTFNNKQTALGFTPANVANNLSDLVSASAARTSLGLGTLATASNLTGPVTSTGAATAIANAAITNAMLANAAVASLSGINSGDQTITLTGGVTGSGAGSFVATVVTNANLTGVVTSTGNATAIANAAITNAMLANAAVANLSGINTGDQTNITGNAATVTTNANLTGPITSTGNATSIAAKTGTGTTFVVDTNPVIKGLLTATNNAGTLPAAPAGTVLQVGGVDGSVARGLVDAFGSNALLTLRRADGTAAAPTAVQLNDLLGSLHFSGYGATAYGSGRSAISSFAAENWTDTAQGSYTTWNTTAIGTTATAEQMRLLGNGNFGHGVTAPTAVLHLKAGTATAGTAPQKLNQGVLLTTTEDGALEYDAGANLFFTLGSTRVPLTGSNLSKSIDRRKKLIIGFAGDSIALAHGQQTFEDNFLQMICSRYYSCDIFWDQRTYANGGYNYGVGGASTTTINSTQIPQIQARTPDVLFINGGTNDGMSALSGAQASAALQQTLINSALAAGVQLVLVYPIGPKTGLVSATQQATWEFNRIMRNFCDGKDGVFYIDCVADYLDPASIIFGPIGGGGGAAGAVTKDGLHPSVVGGQAEAVRLLDLFQQLCRKRQPHFIYQNDVWDATNAPQGNILGSAGLIIGTNGNLDSVANAGVGANWNIVSPNSVTVTPTIVTSSYMAGGYNMQKLAVSGTPGANSSMTMTIAKFSSSYFATTTKWSFEVVVRMNTVVGLSLPSVNHITTGGTNGGLLISGWQNSFAANFAPSGDYHLFLYEGAPSNSNAGNNQHQLIISFSCLNGVAVSGSVEVGFAGIRALN